MYINQTEGMPFHELLTATSAAHRGVIENIAFKALQEAQVECDIDDPSSYAEIIGRAVLQDLPGIREAQQEMRVAFENGRS